jgi:hypothetical protein
MAAVSTRANKKAKSGNLFPLTLPRNKRFLLIYQELATGSAKLGLGLSEVFPGSSGAIVVPKFCTSGKWIGSPPHDRAHIGTPWFHSDPVN